MVLTTWGERCLAACKPPCWRAPPSPWLSNGQPPDGHPTTHPTTPTDTPSAFTTRCPSVTPTPPARHQQGPIADLTPPPGPSPSTTAAPRSRAAATAPSTATPRPPGRSQAGWSLPPAHPVSPVVHVDSRDY